MSSTLASLIEEARATIGEMDARMLTLDQGVPAQANNLASPWRRTKVKGA